MFKSALLSVTALSIFAFMAAPASAQHGHRGHRNYHPRVHSSHTDYIHNGHIDHVTNVVRHGRHADHSTTIVRHGQPIHGYNYGYSRPVVRYQSHYTPTRSFYYGGSHGRSFNHGYSNHYGHRRHSGISFSFGF